MFAAGGREKQNVTKCVRQVAEKEMDLLLSSDRRKKNLKRHSM
jgi:hypothetical protein